MRNDAIKLDSAVLELRTKLGCSQDEFAKRIGVTTRSVSRYETGSHPSSNVLAVLIRLARDLGRLDLAEVFETELSHHVGVSIADARELIPVGPIDDKARAITAVDPEQQKLLLAALALLKEGDPYRVEMLRVALQGYIGKPVEAQPVKEAKLVEPSPAPKKLKGA